MNSCKTTRVEKHDINDFDFIFNPDNPIRKNDVQFDSIYPKDIEQNGGTITDLIYCGKFLSFVIGKLFYLDGVILEVAYSPEAFEAEFRRLKETPSSSQPDNKKYLFDDSKILFNYDVFVDEYPCYIVGSGAYRYALVDYNSCSFKYVYLCYYYNYQYSKDFCFDEDLLPKNLEQNEHYETYDGYYYDDWKRIDNYWPTDIE